MIGAAVFILIVVGIAGLLVAVFRADARAEEAYRQERDEQTRRLLLLLCEALSPPVSAGEPKEDE